MDREEGAEGDSQPGPAQMEGEAWSAGAELAGPPHGCGPEASGTPGRRPPLGFGDGSETGEPCSQMTAQSAPPTSVITLWLICS